MIIPEVCLVYCVPLFINVCVAGSIEKTCNSSPFKRMSLCTVRSTVGMCGETCNSFFLGVSSGKSLCVCFLTPTDI